MTSLSPAEAAHRRYLQQQAIARAAADASAKAWARTDPGNIAASWAVQLDEALAAAAAGQQLAAQGADTYIDEVLGSQDLEAEASGAVVPSRLAGVASDGRPLASLLYQPAIQVLQAIGAGAAPVDALRSGGLSLDMIVRTQVADAGRAATGVGLAARGVGYIRQLSPPSCSRCAILAGRWYRWNAGFKRHPRCDCIHVPTTEARGRALHTDPRAYFNSLSKSEQDRVFTKAGADAIRDGADMAQVVNARRGMTSAGTTTESTTRRGVARPGRLMPEEIYRRSGGDRTEALRLLEQHGYIVRRPAVAAVRAPAGPVPAKAAPTARHTVSPPRPGPAAPPLPPRPPVPPAPSAGMPVPFGARPYHRNLDGIEDLAAAVEGGYPELARVPLTGGVSAETELVTLRGGTRVVEKSAGNPTAEHGASLIGRALGLDAPRVYRNHPASVWMDYIDAESAAEVAKRYAKVSGVQPPWRAQAYNSDTGRIIGLFDLLIANGDRNIGNWLLRAGEPIPIDHGHAFPSALTERRGRLRPSMMSSPFAVHYHDGAGWVRNDLTPADIAEARRRLERLLPDFEHFEKPRWLEYALTVLDAIAPHARGTRNLIAGVR